MQMHEPNSDQSNLVSVVLVGQIEIFSEHSSNTVCHGWNPTAPISAKFWRARTGDCIKTQNPRLHLRIQSDYSMIDLLRCTGQTQLAWVDAWS